MHSSDEFNTKVEPKRFVEKVYHDKYINSVNTKRKNTMPCRCDDFGPAPEPVIPKKKIPHDLGDPTYDELEAMLCGLCSAIEKHGALRFVDQVDWKEAGVTQKKFYSWWKAHKEEDRKRRLKETALNKLTYEEKKALGL